MTAVGLVISLLPSSPQEHVQTINTASRLQEHGNFPCAVVEKQANNGKAPYSTFFHGQLTPVQLMFSKIGGKILRVKRLSSDVIGQVEAETDAAYASIAHRIVCSTSASGSSFPTVMRMLCGRNQGSLSLLQLVPRL